jgi:WD40 repeat protein
MSSDGKRSVAVVDGKVVVKGADDARYNTIATADLGIVRSVCISPTGDWVACLTRDEAVDVDSVPQGRVWLHRMQEKDDWNEITVENANPTAIVFSPDSKRLAIAVQDRVIKRPLSPMAWVCIRTLENNRQSPIDSLPQRGSINALTFSPDGLTLAAAGNGPGFGYAEGENGVIRLFDAVTGLIRITLKGHDGGVHGVAFAPDSRRLVSCTPDEILLWDSTEWQPPFGLKADMPDMSIDAPVK